MLEFPSWIQLLVVDVASNYSTPFMVFKVMYTICEGPKRDALEVSNSHVH